MAFRPLELSRTSGQAGSEIEFIVRGHSQRFILCPPAIYSVAIGPLRRHPVNIDPEYPGSDPVTLHRIRSSFLKNPEDLDQNSYPYASRFLM